MPIALHIDQLSGWNEHHEVVVVGAGGAGLCAALEAARAGASVAVLERASGAGGTTAMCSGHVYAGGGTRAQQANDFKDSVEDLYRYLLACSPSPDAARCRRYADNSLAHFDWLEAQGVPFNEGFYPTRHSLQPDDRCLIWSGNEKAWPFTEHAAAAPRGHKAAGSGDAGHLITSALLAQLEQERCATLHCDTRVDQLVLDGDKVVGVIASQFGEQTAIRAERVVILTAGGFVQNRTMVQNHAPQIADPVLPHGNPYDDGSGIQLGVSAGGATLHMDQVFVTLPFYPPEQLTYGLLINQHGQRFINEDCYHARIGDACMRQTGGKAWLLLDNSCFAQPDFNQAAAMVGDGSFCFEHVATEGSIEALEQALDFPGGSLCATVEQYNRHAEQGQDPSFHKASNWVKPLDTGPYAMIDCSVGVAPYIGFTLGGLWTNVDGEVLDESGATIPGLFAAGRNACGLPRSAAGYASGLSVADATFFGRLAGKAAAAI